MIVPAARAQWQILDAQTTADLHAISSVGYGVAWVSGDGAILHTEDGGRVWKPCAIPGGADKLEFRSIQGFDSNNAIVMSAGKGELSRLYKTVDGCQTWKRVFDNPGASGSFDSLHRVSAFQLYLLGDPVEGKFVVFGSDDGGDTWTRSDLPGLEAPAGIGAFTAATGNLTNVGSMLTFGISGKRSAVYTLAPTCPNPTGKCVLTWTEKASPLAQAANATAGVFAVAGRIVMVHSNAPVTGIGTMPMTTLVAVGGDSGKPAEGKTSAAFSEDGGATWKLSSTQPRGYRSGVDFDANTGRFIAVGPNGTDVSGDDGLDWMPLDPSPGDDPRAGQSWTAISLPFAVGPHGRIGILRSSALNGMQVGEQR